MPRFGFAIDNRVCIGCHACTVACKSEHEVSIGVNRTWVKYVEKGEYPETRRFFNVQRCNHCEDAPCVEICPVTSLYQRPDGIVDFDNSRCIGCKACMQACPYDALHLDPATQTASKCNYCTHRVDAGYEPACVVVCPVGAIVSGDLDDAQGRLAQLQNTQRVQFPKTEKGTHPKLFYVGGDEAALDPLEAPPLSSYLWSGNDGRISLPLLKQAGEEAERESHARRTYDAKSKPPVWGWGVSAYITTKSIAAGLPMIASILYFLGMSDRVLTTAPFLISMLFLGITGLLLVGDLAQPRRFLWVLLRPQWKSWLVRGAYLILAFSILVPVLWLVGLAGLSRVAQLALGWIGLALAASVAAYTALLFAQAKGRDYWQSPMLIASMLADALIAGAAVATFMGMIEHTSPTLASRTADPSVAHGNFSADPTRTILGICVALTAFLVMVELLQRHPTRNAQLTARLITHGRFAGIFWGGAVGLGIILPAVTLWCGGPTWIVALLLVAGVGLRNHVLVSAPQQIPLS